MAAITQLTARVVTGNRPGAGTDGTIYLGICGREFHLDSAVDDFETGSDRTYIMGVGAGEGSTINHVNQNDPRSPQLDTQDLNHFPVYIRIEPQNDGGSNWNLELVIVTVNPGPGQVVFTALGGGRHLWMGTHFGKVCHLK